MIQFLRIPGNLNSKCLISKHLIHHLAIPYKNIFTHFFIVKNIETLGKGIQNVFAVIFTQYGEIFDTRD